ncbi:hypothetical protein [Nonomuraea sp. NPDC003709]|uniref:hypothetical protein n=1 Tax=Nonomuraea sp. NPDC003709 TaxID=3154450 RepID=UPI0033A5EFE2
MTTFHRRGLTEEAAEASIYQACQRLRLPTMRGQFADLAAQAAREQMSYLGFLAEPLIVRLPGPKGVGAADQDGEFSSAEVAARVRLRRQRQRRPRPSSTRWPPASGYASTSRCV